MNAEDPPESSSPPHCHPDRSGGICGCLSGSVQTPKKICHPERTRPQTLFISGVPGDRSSSLGWRWGVVSLRTCICSLMIPQDYPVPYPCTFFLTQGRESTKLTQSELPAKPRLLHAVPAKPRPLQCSAQSSQCMLFSHPGPAGGTGSTINPSRQCPPSRRGGFPTIRVPAALCSSSASPGSPPTIACNWS